ncbi:MAG: single-stranded-DNA-specific exonuclease RecJ [Thiotrichales bacterium]
MKPAEYRLRRRPALTSVNGVPSLLARVLSARGVSGDSELDYALTRLAPVEALTGLASAVERLVLARERDERVLVVGDFDADGATSTALALRGLRALGVRQVDFLVPNRFEFGYGLTPEIVQVARMRDPGLIVTVDNGIASIDGVAAANAAGIDVLITDHHLPGATLPAAVAIVNPNQPGDAFPSKALAGVGVVFYLLIALRQALRARGCLGVDGVAAPNLAQWLDIVALGTVADVVPLDFNNRVLVEQGLRRIRSGRAVVGIQALLAVANREVRHASAADLGYAVGPRLNAAGRLEDMSLGIECLLTDDAEVARTLAARLDDLNRQRREIEADMQSQALEILTGIDLDAAELPWGLTLYGADWHQGVIGILASRIRERVHRPVIAFADAGDGQLKGSARSVPGLHIRDALDWVATHYPGVITRFGGHAMAAGLALESNQLATFNAAFDQAVRTLLPEELLQPEVWSDGALAPDEMTVESAEMLTRAGPWGQAFPPPLFDGEFEVVQRRVLQERHLKYVLRPLRQSLALDAIIFNVAPSEWPGPGESMHIAFRLEVNRFNDSTTLQLMIQNRFG